MRPIQSQPARTAGWAHPQVVKLQQFLSLQTQLNPYSNTKLLPKMCQYPSQMKHGMLLQVPTHRLLPLNRPLLSKSQLSPYNQNPNPNWYPKATQVTTLRNPKIIHQSL